MKQPLQKATVGIIANPASGRDIRRLIARASVFPIAEKCNMVTRLLTALGVIGVERVYLMPDVGGVAERLRRAIAVQRPADDWPEVEFLEMPVEDGPMDTVRAVERMVKAGVAAIVVLGGDGTHRLVASACGETPIMALSTGTNNVFPEIQEATIAGIATGLVATGRIPRAEATFCNKVLQVAINDEPYGLAVVDVTISRDGWTGARALWRPETLSQVFVSFAEADAIGLSSIAGLLRPVSRRAAYGLRVDLRPPETAELRLNVPVAPGLIAPVGVAGVYEIRCGEVQSVQIRQGVIALDGEREVAFYSDQRVTIRLDQKGPLTIDTERVMTRAAEEGLLVLRPEHDERKESSAYAARES